LTARWDSAALKGSHCSSEARRWASCYGGDYNTRKEGRRNFVGHDQYSDIDGVRRLRIKFNLHGDRGHMVVYSEVSKDTPGASSST
jgi:hypothetical protein